MEIPWNCALRDACADAFVAAVDHFNSGSLKYSWPRYLPVRDISGFFRPLKDAILRRLAAKPILESYETMVVPSLLTYVPRCRFSDNKGEPITLSARTKAKYLSSAYQDWVAEPLSSLGIKTLDDNGFLRDLAWKISNEPDDFRRKHKDWHSQLAEVLVSLATDSNHMSLMQDMEIILLRDGNWVSAQTAQKESIFFSKSAKGLNIPKTVEVKIVDPAAEENIHRYNLFTHLGVKSCDAAVICDLILEKHRGDGFQPEMLTPVQLFSHALFMFKASFQPPSGADLWIATNPKKPNREERARSSRVYIRGDAKPNTIEAKISKQLEREYPFIHSTYYEEKSLPKWLRKSFGLSTIHTDNSDSDGSFRLSNEFKFLLKTCASADVLHLLRDHWHEYSKWVEDSGSKEDNAIVKAPRKAIRDTLASTDVQCQSGQDRAMTTRSMPLRKTLLPGLDNVVDNCVYIPTLAIRDPESSKWRSSGSQ